jgi:hypothetical protein
LQLSFCVNLEADFGSGDILFSGVIIGFFAIQISIGYCVEKH